MTGGFCAGVCVGFFVAGMLLGLYALLLLRFSTNKLFCLLLCMPVAKIEQLRDIVETAGERLFLAQEDRQ